ncbi:hypothetical protein [Streptomyces sp. NPDC051214]|uniref:hypothetical protein n=1 Tax=Streptomyces sp. NPDC051214 TaxID=3155282 RepID=UPI00342F9379
MNSPSVQPCPACGGDRVTEHSEHTWEPDKDGNLLPVERRWTGPCSTCNGSGIS